MVFFFFFWFKILETNRRFVLPLRFEIIDIF